jgi:hypothetical protein
MMTLKCTGQQSSLSATRADTIQNTNDKIEAADHSIRRWSFYVLYAVKKIL